MSSSLAWWSGQGNSGPLGASGAFGYHPVILWTVYVGRVVRILLFGTRSVKHESNHVLSFVDGGRRERFLPLRALSKKRQLSSIETVSSLLVATRLVASVSSVRRSSM